MTRSMETIVALLGVAVFFSTGQAQNIHILPQSDTIYIEGYARIATFKWTVVKTGANTDTIAILPTNRTLFFTSDASGKRTIWRQLSICVEDSSHQLDFQLSMAGRITMPPLIWNPIAQDVEVQVLRYPSLKLRVFKNSVVVDSTVQLLVDDVFLAVQSDPSEPSNKLRQNYPNPFNPSTTISFSLERSQRATIQIYNILGQFVTTLISENLSAGTHSFLWNPQHATSGTYFYRLIAEDFTATRKLELLR